MPATKQQTPTQTVNLFDRLRSEPYHSNGDSSALVLIGPRVFSEHWETRVQLNDGGHAGTNVVDIEIRPRGAQAMFAQHSDVRDGVTFSVNGAMLADLGYVLGETQRVLERLGMVKAEG